MRYLRRILLLALVAAFGGAALAQTPGGASDKASDKTPDRPAASARRLVTEMPHPSRRELDAKEYRQAMIRYRAAQQAARDEASRWRGYHPLRPPVAALPFTTSMAVQRQRVLIIPIYVPAP